MIEHLALDVLADLVSSLLLLALTAIVVWVATSLNRRRLLRFFGLVSNRPAVAIYLSRLDIKPGGTTGSDPQIQKGYVGPAINHIEYLAALLLRDLLRSRLVALLPHRVSQWLSEDALRFKWVDPTIEVSPRTFSLGDPDVSGSPASSKEVLIVLGSSVYNSIAGAYLERPGSPYHFGRGPDGRLRMESRDSGEVKGRPSRELGILQRITDRRNGRVVFLCAGLSSSATFGCARYLASEWRSLCKSSAGGDFVVCLAFDAQTPDSELVVTPYVTAGGFHLMES